MIGTCRDCKVIYIYVYSISYDWFVDCIFILSIYIYLLSLSGHARACLGEENVFFYEVGWLAFLAQRENESMRMMMMRTIILDAWS